MNCQNQIEQKELEHSENGIDCNKLTIYFTQIDSHS